MEHISSLLDDKKLPSTCQRKEICHIGGCDKLTVFDWLAEMELPDGQKPFDCVEVRFKNGRKAFYRNVNDLSLVLGNVIAAEATPGHDIGVVSMMGELVRIQMKKKNIDPDSDRIKKLYRKASKNDIKKWEDAQELGVPTMLRAREIALDLNLNMKICDVEYQGDKTKAIFYFTAEERVDFRELIKIMTVEFKVRVEMRQLGMRQESGRVGGIGDCGMEICCSTWLSDFRSVTTNSARHQQLSLNPQKLAGQCGKLKCCLNYEIDTYLDAIKGFPKSDIKLKTEKGRAFCQKIDVFKKLMWYSYDETPEVYVKLSVDRAKEIIKMNKEEREPKDLLELVKGTTIKKL